MTLRIGFDMDGVLADFASAYRTIEDRLFGSEGDATRAGHPEDEVAEGDASEAMAGEASARARVTDARRRRHAVWEAIYATPDFWASLEPTDSGAVRRLHASMLRYRWDVFFITQRPPTLGDTVQRQTQRWLVNQGFDLPSVLVVPASRGAAARALSLDYHVDDSPNNCVDVKTDSTAAPILIVEGGDQTTKASAMRLGIRTAATIGQALEILETLSARSTRPGFLNRLALLAGLR